MGQLGKRMQRGIVYITVYILLFLTIFSIQTIIDTKKGTLPEEQPLYLLSGKLLNIASLGFNDVIADILWMRTIGYFGEHYQGDKKYIWLYHMLDIVTTLDPGFQYPYHFGGLVLSIEGKDIGSSNALLRKGMANHPNVWQFPFYIGFNYFFFEKDYQKAARYFEIASRIPGSPRYLKSLAARLYAESGNPEIALTILKETYINTRDENMRREIMKRIMETEKELKKKGNPEMKNSG